MRQFITAGTCSYRAVLPAVARLVPLRWIWDVKAVISVRQRNSLIAPTQRSPFTHTLLPLAIKQTRPSGPGDINGPGERDDNAGGIKALSCSAGGNRPTW